ncbi:hypothetical protein LXL04_033604 [Taraxacum kok-saghyz]
MDLVYGAKDELQVKGYVDSCKQDTVVDSTCESEYIATCEVAKEAVRLKNIIGDLGVAPVILEPLEIFCDNEGQESFKFGGSLDDRNLNASTEVAREVSPIDVEMAMDEDTQFQQLIARYKHIKDKEAHFSLRNTRRRVMRISHVGYNMACIYCVKGNESWDILRTHRLQTTRELPQFSISPKPIGQSIVYDRESQNNMTDWEIDGRLPTYAPSLPQCRFYLSWDVAFPASADEVSITAAFLCRRCCCLQFRSSASLGVLDQFGENAEFRALERSKFCPPQLTHVTSTWAMFIHIFFVETK